MAQKEEVSKDTSLQGMASEEMNEIYSLVFSRFEGGMEEVQQLVEQDKKNIKDFMRELFLILLFGEINLDTLKNSLLTTLGILLMLNIL